MHHFWGGPQSKSNIAYINDSFLWTEVSKFFRKSLKVNVTKSCWAIEYSGAWYMHVDRIILNIS